MLWKNAWNFLSFLQTRFQAFFVSILAIYFISMRIYVFYKVCSLTHKVFKRILAKNFVDSIIIATFAVEFERTEKNGRDDDSN